MFPMDATYETDKVMEALASALAKHMPQTKAQTTGAPLSPYTHGPGGLFGVRGLEQALISTHTTPEGFVSALPFIPSMDQNPLVPYLTGFVRSDQQEKDGVCDDPPDAGPAKTCIGTAQFGRKEFKTRQLEVNRVGQRINRGEFNDLTLVNSPLVNQMAGIVSSVIPVQNQADALNLGRDMVMRMMEVGVAFQRWFCPTTFTGNPTNNSAGGGYKEFPGLDLLIGTGKVDALAGTTCPSLDSLVRSWNYASADSATADPTIVEVIHNMFRYLKRKASAQNFGGVQWVMVMRPELFDVLVDLWPCVYNTYRCVVVDTAGINTVPNLDSAGQRAFGDQMRNGRYLMVDGMRIPVILDNCITEETQSDVGAIPLGCFASDIYIVPLTVRNGTFRSTFWEYFNYNQGPLNVVSDANRMRWWWSDSGVFMWGEKAPDNWCYELICKTEPRLRLLTPQLAARLTDIVYCPLIHYDDPLPSSEYWLNGGVTSGYPTLSPYSEWNASGPGIGA